MSYPKINYIGNKEKIADWIVSYFPKDASSVFDAFSGGCSVGYLAKEKGYQVFSNDIMLVNYHIGKALIENSSDHLTPEDVDLLFSGEPFEGFVYNHYSNVYYFPEECMQLDQYRRNIDLLDNDYKKSLALLLLRRAMIRKMPYSRFNIKWEKVKQLRDENFSYSHYKRKRAYHNKSFKYHFLCNLDSYNSAVFDNGKDNKAYNMDVFDALKNIKADIVYLDPPYTGTMNNYYEFYGFLDNYIAKREIPPFTNNFVNKASSLDDFNRLFANLQNYRYWILSYNSVSKPNKEEMLDIISKYAYKVEVVERPYAYKVTGRTMKNGSKEYLFIAKK